jgi:hypothetical protein
MRRPLLPRWARLAVALACLGSAATAARADETAPAPPSSDPDFVDPLQAPAMSLGEMCQAVPPCCRDRTHVFFLNGIDWPGFSNLQGLCDYLRAAGFRNVTWGSMFDGSAFRTRICRIRECDPDARVVLLGYSYGANRARSLMHALAEDGVHVDLLIYLGGDTIWDCERSRPANACRILNITGHGFWAYGFGFLCRGDNIAGAENLRLSTYHLGLPSHPETVEAVVRAVVETAQSGPDPGPSTAAPVLPELVGW